MMENIKMVLNKIVVFLIYKWALLFYDDKYLRGKWFPKDHYAIGWQKVIHCWYHQKVRKINNHVPWPVPETVQIGNPNNIEFDVDEIANFWSIGCYFQALGAKLIIGKRTIIAPGVGLITSNHNLNDLWGKTEGKDIIIGDDCWIGMNAVILPGVVLGNHTVVGAGTIVTQSFSEGYCVLVGNPARKVKDILIDEEGKYYTQRVCQ